MARKAKRASNGKKVEALTHEAARRRNLATAELSAVAECVEELDPVGPVRFRRPTPLPKGEARPRDLDLDPQIIWNGARIRLTRPWTTTKSYRRSREPHPAWREVVCSEDNQHVKIGPDDYFLSADGKLMPAPQGPSAARPQVFQAGVEVISRFLATDSARRRAPLVGFQSSPRCHLLGPLPEHQSDPGSS